MSIEELRDGESLIIADDDRAPILVTTWFGAATLKNVDRFFAWAEARAALAKKSGSCLVLICDALNAERPGPEVRQAFTRMQLDSEVVIASPVVLTNPLVRGAMTAIGWIMGDRMKGVTSWSTIEEAVDAARKALAARGVRVDPHAFDGYLRPRRTGSGRATG